MRAVMILVVVIAGCAADVVEGPPPSLEPVCDSEDTPRCEGGSVICDDAFEASYWCRSAVAGRDTLLQLVSDGDPMNASCATGVPTCPDGFPLRCVPCPEDIDALPECPTPGGMAECL